MITTQLGFSFDLSRCSGCMACMAACFDRNDMPGNGSTFRHVSRIETGTYPSVNIRYASHNPNILLALAHQTPQS